MARISGYKCDAPKCAVTAESTEAKVPIGWMTLAVRAHVAGRTNGDGPTSDDRADFHVCSNKCLKALATERHAAAVARGEETGSYYSRRKQEAAS